MKDLELFAVFNVDCKIRPYKPTLNNVDTTSPLAFPTAKPLWEFKTKTDRAEYDGPVPIIDLAPQLPGLPGSEERMEYLRSVYAGQVTGQRNNEPVFDGAISPFDS